MKEFFYRLSWDDDYKNRLFKRWLIILGSAIGVLCLVFCCVMVAVSQPISDNGGYFDKAEDEEKKGFDLIFSDNKWKNEEENKDNSESSGDQQNNDSSGDNNTSESNNTSGNSGGGTSDPGGGGSSGGGGEVPAGHTHSWHKVVDSGAWTETKQVFVGYLYICNNCGFSTSDSGAMSSHCSRMSHSFRSTPRYETQEIYHPEVSHEECSCGARR